MICDQLSSSIQYDALGPRLHEALAYLRKTDLSSLADGRYEIGGDGSFMKISTSVTKLPEQAKPEAHRAYLDIQYIISGCEYIGYCPLSKAVLLEEHPDRDIAFYRGPMNYIRLEASDFMVVFPQDVHAPGVALETPCAVRKAVIKIPI